MSAQFIDVPQYRDSARSHAGVSYASIFSKGALLPHRTYTHVFAILLEDKTISRLNAQRMPDLPRNRNLPLAGYFCLLAHLLASPFLTITHSSLLLTKH